MPSSLLMENTLLNQMEGGIPWAERLGVFSDEKLRNRRSLEGRVALVIEVEKARYTKLPSP